VSIRQRLYPASGDVGLLDRHCSHSRFVWNLALEQANYYRRDRGPSPNNAMRMRQLAEARQEFDWLAAGSSSVQQAALRDFDLALRNWWAGTHRRPTWRKAQLHNGFHVRDLSVTRLNRKWATVLVPKCGYVRFRVTRAWHDIEQASSARVTLDRAGRWWVSFTTPPPAFERKPTGAVVGIDRGVANSIATSDGLMLNVPSLTAGEQARFLTLARRLSRQQKGANRRAATRTSLARLYARLGDRRKDWIEQTSTALVRGYDLIAVEDLRTKQMTRKPKAKPDPDQPTVFLPNGARAKAGLNKAILASCWGGLEQRLEHKTSLTTPQNPSVLVKVDPRNTSRTCAVCGHVAKENRESQAVFTCQSCGHEAHADTNAAINIRQRALNPVLRGNRGIRSDRPRTDASVSAQAERRQPRDERGVSRSPGIPVRKGGEDVNISCLQ
jgi:transposase